MKTLQGDAMSNHHTIGNGITVKHYDLYFEPNFENSAFKARARIEMQLEKATSTITLNAKELNIHSATVTSKDKEYKAKVSHPNEEEMILTLDSKVNGNVILTIAYEGIHNDHLYGFYKSSYEHKGKKNYLLSSQFEAPNARAAFPCIDEPEFKATFDVSLLIDTELEAVSNMPIKNTERKGAKKLVTFKTTPRMSTYLLYLGVGKYDSLKGRAGNVEMTVFAHEGRGAYTTLPLEYAQKLFISLQNYFEVPYPLPKLDLLGIPDFAAGAMENWGAMTFRETALLGTEQTSVRGKQRIAEVVAHEIAHQWFGDLVTMRWWDDMWLNESFATFMAYKAVEDVFPEWKIMLEYYTDTVGTAFVADGMKNTHPISVQVNTAGEIEELFDAIGYNKGGSVLLMLEDFVGHEVFRKGLVRYLEKHAYSNATKKDLWESIEQVYRTTGGTEPIITIMEDWINREGYPVIHVRKTAKGFELRQERFSISGNTPGVWKIPLKYLCEKKEGKVLMDKERLVLENTGSWIKLNYGQAGFYRVNYEEENLKALGEKVKQGTFEPLDIWGLENDLFALVRAGKRPIDDYVSFIENFCLECGYPADENIASHLSWLNSIGHGMPFITKARELDMLFQKKIIARVGYTPSKNESTLDTKLRSLAAGELGRLKEKETVAWVRTTFEAYQKGKPLDANMRGAVFYTTAYNAPSKDLFTQFLAIYKGNGSPEEKVIALQALGMLCDTSLLSQALELSISKDVRLQDSLSIPGVVAGSNPLGRKMYRDWALKNWKHFLKIYSPSSHMLRACVSAFGMLADRESKEKIETFFTDSSNMRDDIRLAVKQALEKIEANVRFIEKNTR